MLKRIHRKFFYNPEKFIQSLSFIKKHESAILMPSSDFLFYAGTEGFKGHITIGADTMVGCQFIFETLDGNITLGERTFINGSTKLISRSSIHIGSDVTIAWDCTIYDHNSHSLDWRERAKDIQNQLSDSRAGRNFIASKDWSTVKAKPITIEDKVWIGFGCTILAGVTIGEGAVVGAQTVVRQNVEPWTVVVGNPAQVVKRLRV